jgi:hypothetical protein
MTILFFIKFTLRRWFANLIADWQRAKSATITRQWEP